MFHFYSTPNHRNFSCLEKTPQSAHNHNNYSSFRNCFSQATKAVLLPSSKRRTNQHQREKQSSLLHPAGQLPIESAGLGTANPHSAEHGLEFKNPRQLSNNNLILLYYVTCNSSQPRPIAGLHPIMRNNCP